MPLRLVLALVLALLTLPSHGNVTLTPDTAATDDATPVMVDVLANDHGSGGRPMVLKDARSLNCPGTVVHQEDGTVELWPNTVSSTVVCEIEYDVEVGSTVATSTIAMTVAPSGSDGGGGGGGGGGGNEPLLGVPASSINGCVAADGVSPGGASEEKCCWRELLRAIDKQDDLAWNTIDVLKVRSNSLNKRLLCRAADYFSEDDRPLGVGTPNSRDWFYNDLVDMANRGWMDDGECPGGTCGHRGSNEILSPLYGSWHTAAYMAALHRARETNDAPLITLLEGWLRTYWTMNALTAHNQPLTQATTVTSTSCSGSSETHTVTRSPGEWDGLSLANAGLRRLGNECSGGVPRGALTTITQPGHYLTALALDAFPRQWNVSGIGCSPTASDGCANYHDATRVALLLAGHDYLAIDGGTPDLESISIPAGQFGLTQDERDELYAFVQSPATDKQRLINILGYVNRDHPWRPESACPMTFLRTTEGTLSRFGTDSASSGQWLKACNLNKPPIYAAVVRNDGTGTYLSPGGLPPQTTVGLNDASERQGDQIVAQGAFSGTRSIARPGGSLLYRVEWSHNNGLVIVENNLPDGNSNVQEPYLGSPQNLPGRLEAEHYDTGGADVAWSDATATNDAPSPFRDGEGVDAGTFDGRTAVTDTEDGEWLEYSINVTATGGVDLQLDYRNPGPTAGRVRLEFGSNSALVDLPVTGSAWLRSAPVELTGLLSGEQFLRLRVLDGGFDLDAIELMSQNAERLPYTGSALPLPGRVEAEFFDIGGDGFTWSDTTPTNTGVNPFRPSEGVDVAQYDVNRIAVTGIATNEWLEYSVDLATGGDFALSVEYRTVAGAGSLRFEVRGTSVSETLALPDLGSGWQHAHRFDLTGLPAGEQIVRLTLVQPGFELDGFWLTELGEPQVAFGGTPTSLPGTLQVEHYDEGDPGDAYLDSTPWTIPTTDAFRADDWVDTVTVPEGTVVSWIDSGEWLEYTVDMAQEGAYPLEIRYSSHAAGLIQITVTDGGVLESATTIPLPSTGDDWQVQPLGTVYAGSGLRVLRLEFIDSPGALNWLRFDSPEPPEPPTEPMPEHDTIYVPRDAVDWPIPYADLVANDEPEGLVVVGEAYWLPDGLFFGELERTQSAFLFTPPANWSGTSEFKYEADHVLDPSAYRVRGRVVLRPLDELPVAHDDDIEVLTGSEIAIYHSTLFANDSGSSLELDGIEMQPASGPLVEASNYLVYIAPSAPTVESFSYRLKDRFGNHAPEPGVVTITVTDSPSRPVANNDRFLMAEQTESGQAARLTVLDNIVMANDSSASSAANLIVLDTGSGPSCGSLPLHQASFGWQYTAGIDCGIVTWMYELEDTNSQQSDTATILVEVVPAPVGGEEQLETSFGQSLQMSPSLLVANDNGFGLSLVFLHETVTQPTPAGAGTVAIDLNGNLQFTPAAGFVGDATFTYQVRNDMLERSPADMFSPGWDTTSEPVPVTITVQAPDAAAHDDVAMARADAPFVDLLFDLLLANDEPAAELDLVSHTDPALGTVQRLSDRLRFVPTPAFRAAGSDTFTYGVRRVGGSGFVATATVRVESEAPCSGYGDDFESGSLDGWPARSEVGGTLSVTSSAALEGGLGLRVDLPAGATSVRLIESSLDGVSHPRVSFLFDPNSITLGASQVHPIAAVGDTLLWLTRVAGTYRVRLGSVVGGSIVGTLWVGISDEPHRFVLEAASANGLGVGDGWLRLWIDDLLRGEVTGLDNHGAPTTLTATHIGGLWSLGGVDGSYFFDDYRACPGPESRQAVQVDGFEDWTLDAWDQVDQVGGTIAVDNAAGLEGNRGVKVDINTGATAVRLRSDAVAGEAHLHASFLLDATALSMAEGDDAFVAGLAGSGGWVYHVHLGLSGGQLRVRQVANLDSGWSGGPWVNLGDATLPHRIGLEWWQASRPDQADGGARLAIDGVIVDEMFGLDNDTRVIDSFFVGAVAGLDAGTTGTLLLDSVQVWRGDGARRNQLLDGFEDGAVSTAWGQTGGAGGSLVVSPSAALLGNQGLEVQITAGSSGGVNLGTDRVSGTRHLASSFLLDPASLTLTDGQEIFLFGGASANGWHVHLRLGISGGQYRLRLVAALDGTAWATTQPVALTGSGTAQRIGVEWWLPSAPNASDGGARLSLDGTTVEALLGLDNDEEAFDDLMLGAMALTNVDASGSLLLDDIQIWTLEP